jgi:hypothetical protein
MSIVRGRYFGSSRDRKPDEEPTLENAVLDAYEKGMAAKDEVDRRRTDGSQRLFRFRVDAIFVEGTNPPTDYKFELVDH